MCIRDSLETINGGRKIYQKIDENYPCIWEVNQCECIWWHDQSRQWWIGDCLDIKNKTDGHAHSEENQWCPTDTNQTWKKANGREIPGVKAIKTGNILPA